MIGLLNNLRRLRRQLRLSRPSTGSLAIRMVDAGSCNGCEHELNALGNPYYDLARFGANFVASPRHADVLLVSGPVTSAMVEPLRHAYAAMPEPRRVAALGNCALGLDLLGVPGQCGTGVDAVLPVDIRIAGCPPTPDQIAAGLLQDRGPRAQRGGHAE